MLMDLRQMTDVTSRNFLRDDKKEFDRCWTGYCSYMNPYGTGTKRYLFSVLYSLCDKLNSITKNPTLNQDSGKIKLIKLKVLSSIVCCCGRGLNINFQAIKHGELITIKIYFVFPFVEHVALTSLACRITNITMSIVCIVFRKMQPHLRPLPNHHFNSDCDLNMILGQ